LRLARRLAASADGKTRLMDVDARVTAKMQAALDFALKSPLPATQAALENVFG
jgi:hypothetical protein